MHIDLIDETDELLEEQEQLLRDILQFTVTKEQVKADCELSVVIVSDEEIKQLNANYRGKDTPTDVLSFPMYTKEQIRKHNEAYPLLLGDLVISFERAKAQAKEYDHSFMRELAFLAVHGLLHLLGYTHDTVDNERIMFQKQEAILKEFQLERT